MTISADLESGLLPSGPESIKNSGYLSSIFNNHYQRVSELHNEKISGIAESVIGATKLVMAVAPLAFIAAPLRTSLITATIAAPFLTYGATQGIAYLRAKSQHPINDNMSDDEKAKIKADRGQNIRDTGIDLRRKLDWVLNPVGNLVGAAALKGLDSLQKSFTTKNSLCWKTLQAGKVVGYYGLRMLTPTPWYYASSVLHNFMLSLDGGNPLPFSREMQQRPPYLFSDSGICTRVLTWEKAPSVMSPIGDLDADGPELHFPWAATEHTVKYCDQEMIQSADKFGFSQEQMINHVEDAFGKWASYTGMNFIRSEEAVDGADCDIAIKVAAIGIAGEGGGCGSGDGTILINPNPDIGPRWTDSEQMLPNTMAHEIGHVLGLKHFNNHYSIMHAGPRWEAGMRAPSGYLPEHDLAALEGIKGIIPNRQPGLQPRLTQLCTEISYMAWRILQEHNPLKIL